MLYHYIATGQLNERFYDNRPNSLVSYFLYECSEKGEAEPLLVKERSTFGFIEKNWVPKEIFVSGNLSIRNLGDFQLIENSCDLKHHLTRCYNMDSSFAVEL